MEKLIQGDQDKTELLEQMRKEKDQLFLSLSEQVARWKIVVLVGTCKTIYMVLVSVMYLGISAPGKASQGIT